MRRKEMVPREGLEPPCLSATDFESAASTIPPPGHGVHKRAHVLAFWSPSVHSFADLGTPLNWPHERSRPRPLYDPALRLDPGGNRRRLASLARACGAACTAGSRTAPRTRCGSPQSASSHKTTCSSPTPTPGLASASDTSADARARLSLRTIGCRDGRWCSRESRNSCCR